MRTAAELREGFLSYFESKGHLRRPSAPLIPPADDASTLFIVAGMQPMKKWFLGAEAPPAMRVVTSQKVMRAGGKHADLDDVGSTARHASFFEMLGNFSFGDYFKAEAIPFAWEFVTEHMGFPEERLWATVFAGDPELGLGEDDVAVQGWLDVGLPRERIVGQPRSENFWQAADTGPCGPCSEIFYDRGPEHGCGDPTCGPNCERCERYLEFWNLVFMEYDLAADGTLTPLPQQNIDTGLGLERGAMLLQEVGSIFDTDGYQAIMRWVAEESGVAYGASEQATKAHRVLADHGRAMVFLISEGITPSNEGRGYIVRRLIRRAVQQGNRIGLTDVYRLPGIVIEQVAGAFPELVEQAAEIERVVKAEEARFGETLERGLKVFEELAGKDAISGEDAFTLAATYGFPLELTIELAEERGQPVDVDDYRARMAEHRTISRAGGESDTQRAADFARASDPTTFVGYHKTDVLTELHAYEDLGDGTFLAKLRETPFYAASGGQVTDQGVIELDGDPGTRAELLQAHRVGDDQVLVFRGIGLCRRQPRACARAVERALPDDGEPHRDAPPAGGAPRGARRPRQAGRLGRSPRQAALRLHARPPAHSGGAGADRAPRQPGDLREPPAAHLRDADRRGAQARRDDALRREVRRHRAGRRDRGRLAGALRRHARPLDRRDRLVRDPLRGLGRLRRPPHRGRHLGRGVGAAPRPLARARRRPPRARGDPQGAQAQAGCRRAPAGERSRRTSGPRTAST